MSVLTEGYTSSPKSSLDKFMRDHSEACSTGEVWAVYDDDHKFQKHDLPFLDSWQKENPKSRRCALSKPKFEYWLLLHFEDGHGIRGTGDLDRRIDKHLPGYKKIIEGKFSNKFTKEKINAAVERAKRSPKFCENGADPAFYSGVFQLVERIQELEEQSA